MADIPNVFTGGWVRQGISLDGGPFLEDAVVWWLQAPVMHADLRVPDDGTSEPTCFAGDTSWDGAALTWTRTVDLERYAGVDSGTASWDGEDLLESGEFVAGDGTSTRYVERWVRLPDSAGPLLAEERDGVHAVRAGDHAVTIADRRAEGGAFHGTAWIRSRHGWTVHHTLPGTAPAPSPADLWAAR